jgi:thioredoxin reductase
VSPPAAGPGQDRPTADHDVVVVGGGPAGLNAALVLGRSRRSVLVVDDGQPRNRFAAHMHGFLGLDGTPPSELIARGREECERYGVTFRAAHVSALRPAPTQRRIEVTLADGPTLTARRVLVTTGLRDELPEIAGVAERWGRDVLHCPYCHGWENRDAGLVVVAGRPDEVEKALVVRQWSPQVTLALHGMRAEDVEDETLRRLGALGVEVVEGPVGGLVVEHDRITGVRLDDDRVLDCDAVVVQPRMVARDELLVAVGAETAAGPFGEYVVTDESGSTGVPGVWATGNVADPQSQVVMAAADGYRAAVAIDHDLVLEDVDLAVARAATD